MLLFFLYFLKFIKILCLIYTPGSKDQGLKHKAKVIIIIIISVLLSSHCDPVAKL